MSFYIVPSVLYQTQQKMKKSAQEKAARKQKAKKAMKEASKTSSSSSTNESVRSASIYEDPHEDTRKPTSLTDSSLLRPRVECDTKSLTDAKSLENKSSFAEVKRSALRETRSTESLSIDIANKYSISNNEAQLGERPGSYPENDTTAPQLLDSDKRRNSTSTTASTPASFRGRFRRNSSLSTNNSSGLKEGAKERSKMNVMTNSNNQSPNPNYDSTNDSDRSSKIFKPSYTMTQSEKFPEFNTIRDLSILNTLDGMHNSLYSPHFQIFRYNNFLDIISSQHKSDPINFAGIRLNSISKFLVRHSQFSNVNIEDHLKSEIKDFEGILAYNLINMRSFIRDLIKIQSTKDSARTEIFSCEELVQVNFTNYIRFLLNLPQKFLTVPAESLDELLLTHQKFKVLFTQIIKALYNFKREDSGDYMTNMKNAVDYFMQLITKVSYDFILLEKYHINILSKFNDDSLMDNQIVLRLFSNYQDQLHLLPGAKKRLPKVLFYNSYFSAQYSWYLSVHIPFVSVVEMNVLNENSALIADYDKYQGSTKDSKKHDFEKEDEILFNSYFDKLNLDNFKGYKALTGESLVSLQRSFESDNASVKSDGSYNPSLHKPKNFQFYSESLSTIKDGTFDIIHSRDLFFQLTNSNINTIIREFHRILRIGGNLDIAIILSGSDTITPGSTIVKLPVHSSTIGLNLAEYYEMIPNFAEVLFTMLASVFGDGNVQFATILMNGDNEVLDFLVTNIGLHLTEMVSKTDSYSRYFESKVGQKNDLVHFLFKIIATKTVQ